MTDPSSIDPQDFIARCRAAQRRGVLATIRTSTIACAPAGARIAFHPGGYVESDLADGTVQAHIARDARAVVASGTSTTRSYSVRGGTIEVELAAVVPPPRLFVFGAGELAAQVFEAARRSGWEPFACSHFTCHADHAAMIDGSDRAAAIVIGNGDALDGMVIEALLATTVRYIGVAGPGGRIEPLIAHLAATLPDSRVHAPIHVDGANAPARAIALALVTEAHAVVSGVTPIRPSLRRLALPELDAERAAPPSAVAV